MKKNIKKGITTALEIPLETVMNIPVITLCGNCELDIENCKSILEYTAEKIVVNTEIGIVEIEGISLELKSVTSEVICIKGNITNLSFKEF